MSKVKIVAATGCPTGIAHTFMAEESLKKAAEKLGVDIKVETNGQDGVQHQLTKQDIQEADGVIIDADKEVDDGRFKNIQNNNISVSKWIINTESLNYLQC